MGNKYIRLSHVLQSDTPSYGNRDKVIIRVNSSIKSGDTANSSCWVFSNNHIGTHLDVPRHFNEQGFCVSDIPVEDFFFQHVAVIDISCETAKLIIEKDIECHTIDSDIDLLLIRTGYENFRQKEAYWNDNPGLSSELPSYLRSKFPYLRCIGFDFISITSWKYRLEGRLAHKAFLSPRDGERPIIVIEDMSLKNIEKQIKEVIVAPMYVEDGNGAPVTVFAEIE
ncbi:cyclase [Bacteroidia bacterium]|nr:cyclase [Bacteroidia bacterium]